MGVTKHHPKCREALKIGFPATIECSSKDEMESLFLEIVQHYGSKVISDMGSDLTAFKWLMTENRSARAKATGMTHRIVEVKKWQGLSRNGQFYRIRLSPSGSYDRSGRIEKACCG